MRKTTKAHAHTKRTTQTDPLKDAANELVDAMVASNGARTMEFAAQLAAERARAHASTGAFPLRSLNNRLYLEAQARKRGEDPKFLFAGVDQFRKMERAVLEDAKPYKIYGPRCFDVKDVDEFGQETTRTVFRRAHPILDVYDWTQTRSVNPDYVEPDWETPLAAGDNETLRDLMKAADIPVELRDLSASNSHGHYDGEKIVIDETAAVGNQIVELTRQLAHHVLEHPPVGTRQARTRVTELGQEPYTARYVAEQEAALTGWLVAKALGLDETVGNEVTAQCAEYLNRWTKFDKNGVVIDLEGIKSRRKLVVERLEVALKAADTILSAYCTTRDRDLVTA